MHPASFYYPGNGFLVRKSFGIYSFFFHSLFKGRSDETKAENVMHSISHTQFFYLIQKGPFFVIFVLFVVK